MPCHACGAAGVQGADRCPDCGTPLGVDGSFEQATDGGTGRRLLPDGGEQPAGDGADEQTDDGADDQGESTSGQSASEQSPDGQPSGGQRGGGQPGDGQPTGGQPADGQPAGQPTGGQSGGGQPSGRPGGQQPTNQPGGGQPTGGRAPSGQPGGGPQQGQGQPTGGQSAGGQPARGQPAGQGAPAGQGSPAGQGAPAGQPTGQPAGQPAPAGAGGPDGGGAVGGGYGQRGGSVDVGALLASLPFGRGALLGLLSMLLPFAVTVGAALALVQQRAAAAGANVFFMIVGFGSGERIVELFVLGSDISDLENVRPADYPSVEGELARVLDVLLSTPEALLLGVFVVFPLVCYLGGRYLARKYTTEDQLVERAVLPLTLVAGTLPFAILIAAAFPVAQAGTRIVVAGILLPLVFGLAGTMTVTAFGRYSWFTSKAYGWAAALVGYVIASVLLPLPSLPASSGLQFQIDLAQRFVLGIEAFLATTSFGIGRGVAGFVIFLLAAIAVLAAGFLRVHRSSEHLPTYVDGARLGASVVLGYLAIVALLGVVLPLLTILIPVDAGSLLAGDVPLFGIDFGWFAAVLPDVAKFTRHLLLGGVVFPMLFGGLGGAAAIWYRDRQQRQGMARQPRQPRQPQA